MNPAVQQFTAAVAATPPETWYDCGKKEFLTQDAGGDWIGFTEAQYKRILKGCGIPSKMQPGETLSPIDAAIVNLQMNRNVHYAGPVAGFRSGFQQFGGTRVLVTTSPKIIEPAEGECTTLQALIEGLLGADDGVQLPYFYGWVKIAYEALRAGQLRPGQALVMCGAHRCGKSLLQNLITEILGGRSAKPYQAMCGGTSFNADLIGAEHLVVEDEQPSTDIRARRAFGAQIKAVTVNETQRLHQKGRDAMLLKTFWRITISLNAETENVQVLPPLDGSLEDKICLFKAVRAPMPMPTGTMEQREAFWDRLVADIPGFLDFLCKMEIPKEIQCQRFGVKHFHHPEIVASLDSLSPEARLLTLIDAYIFATEMFLVKGRDYYETTAEELEMMLTDSNCPFAHAARPLFSWAHACGTYLGRLAKKQPERVQQSRTADSRKWRITAPGDPQGTGK